MRQRACRAVATADQRERRQISGRHAAFAQHSAVLLEKQNGGLTASYLYSNALVKKDSETLLYDGLGSSRQSTDNAGAVTSSRTYETFGQSVASSGVSSSPYQFAATSGYRNDGDAGLMHVGARYYDAQVGRFITRDTLLDQKAYAYCEADPVNWVDPSGHRSITGAIVGWLAGQGISRLITVGVIVAFPGLGLAGVIVLGVVAGLVGGGVGSGSKRIVGVT